MTAVLPQSTRSSIFSPQIAAYSTNGMPYDMPDRRMSSANEGLYMPAALILRKLPLTTTTEAVRTMLLFAKDLQDTELVSSEYDEDKGFATAIARFSSMTGASEAQAMLDGKPNTAGQANMIVEMLPSSAFNNGFRRNTIDPVSTRPIPPAASPLGRAGRFAGQYSALDKMSPPPATSPPEANMFQAHSPRGTHIQDRTRISGKSMIGEDGGDDGNDVLKDSMAFMGGENSMANVDRRRQNGLRQPLPQFGTLSLNTGMPSPSPGAFYNPRTSVPIHSPHAPFSPANGPYSATGNPYLRHNYPPVNPADQNPPCNTLYVGNLPMDTSEDELKAMFSKQRGYKRLCFRTKQNGPMCFVEFEDISFATKALNELYGAQLHNSIKGGIRLSFSKNPLGVRSGQPGSNANPSTPLSPSGANLMNGMAPMSPGAFSTANGPPPGLSVPSGFPPGSVNIHGQYAGAGLGMRNPQAGGGPELGSVGGMYPDYMMGR